MSKVRHVITREMPQWKCPHCGKVLSGATAAVEDPLDAIPVEGQPSVCAYCHTVLLITSAGYELATREDWEMVAPEGREVVEKMLSPLHFRAENT